MKTTNLAAADNTALETVQPKHERRTRFSHYAKKAVLFATVAGIMAVTLVVPAFAAENPPKAATGVVDTSSFITTACTVLKSVICLIGGGVSLWGVVNLLEGYGNDNPGAKLQGW